MAQPRVGVHPVASGTPPGAPRSLAAGRRPRAARPDPRTWGQKGPGRRTNGPWTLTTPSSAPLPDHRVRNGTTLTPLDPMSRPDTSGFDQKLQTCVKNCFWSKPVASGQSGQGVQWNRSGSGRASSSAGQCCVPPASWTPRSGRSTRPRRDPAVPCPDGWPSVRFLQYDDGIHPYAMENAPPSMYDPHVAHRPTLQSLSHHSPHMNHAGMHQYHGNHVSTPVSNHVMGSVPDVHKRDKDAIYGWVLIKCWTARRARWGNAGAQRRCRRRESRVILTSEWRGKCDGKVCFGGKILCGKRRSWMRDGLKDLLNFFTRLAIFSYKAWVIWDLDFYECGRIFSVTRKFLMSNYYNFWN